MSVPFPINFLWTFCLHHHLHFLCLMPIFFFFVFLFQLLRATPKFSFSTFVLLKIISLSTYYYSVNFSTTSCWIIFSSWRLFFPCFPYIIQFKYAGYVYIHTLDTILRLCLSFSLFLSFVLFFFSRFHS